MDYLDPQKKRAHRRRILVGYVLFGIVIAIATTILIYVANGYDIDRKTGAVIQNGLLFVDAKPTQAKMTLNGVVQNGTTDARLVVPAGEYSLGLSAEGYRPWNRTFTLEGGTLRRLTYARLVPEVLTPTNGAQLRSEPFASLQSIDKRWIVVTHADQPTLLTLIDTLSTPIAVTSLQLPVSAFPATTVSLTIDDWAADNRHFIVRYTTTDQQVGYVLVPRDAPENSQNLSTLFAVPTARIQMIDRSIDSYYVYRPDISTLFRASLVGGIAAEPVLENVLAFAAYQTNWLVYVQQGEKPEEVAVRFKHNDNDILLRTLPSEKEYLLELAKLGSAPVIGVGFVGDVRAAVYNDPENYLKQNKEARIPVATTMLRVPDIKEISISSDASIIAALGSSNIATHEFEADRTYTFARDLALPDTAVLRWMDGQHLVYGAGPMQVLVDFDGNNRYDLVPGSSLFGSYFSEDYTSLITVASALPAAASGVATPATLQITSMIASGE